MLNKFPIIAEHFILATKINKKQTHALEQDDLEATYACLKEWQEASRSRHQRLFAFFNSGPHSGASQPHRHLQFLPLERMHEGDMTSGWDLLIDLIMTNRGPVPQGTINHHGYTTKWLSEIAGTPHGLLQHADIPFAHFAVPFKSTPSGSELMDIYKRLFSAAKTAADGFNSTHPLRPSDSVDSDDLPISYNLALTTSGMIIMPRRNEGTMLFNADGIEIGFVALNGTTLGGTLMVKHEKEWELLRQKPEMLDGILAAIGFVREPQPSRSHV